MSLPLRIHRAWVRLCIDARRLWAWHTAQMRTNGRYARAIIDGAVRLLWQETIDRFLIVLGQVLIEIFTILRQDGISTAN